MSCFSVLSVSLSVWPLRYATAVSGTRPNCTAVPSVSLPSTATAPARLHAGMNTSRSAEPSRRSAMRPARMFGEEKWAHPAWTWEEETNEICMRLKLYPRQYLNITINHWWIYYYKDRNHRNWRSCFTEQDVLVSTLSQLSQLCWSQLVCNLI